jgi:hypothetical protein
MRESCARSSRAEIARENGASDMFDMWPRGWCRPAVRGRSTTWIRLTSFTSLVKEARRAEEQNVSPMNTRESP